MFAIGDKVVYPVHGAGIIEAIEKKEVLGEEKDYYVLRICSDNMNVMVPVDNSMELGMREIIDISYVEKVLQVLRTAEEEVIDNWNKRYRANMDKVKSGDICQVACVVRGLSLRHMAKGLSSGEKRLLDYAKKILISELMLSCNENSERIEQMLSENIV